jgi:hypothetical protein
MNSTWDFAANETEIVLDSAPNGTKIAALTATNLALEYTETFSDGTTWVQTQIFAAR